MTGSKSKQKGNTFEREVASYLSSLYNDSFIRASHSGAYVGGSNIFRKDILSTNQVKSFKGDIIPPDNWSRFNAEAKSYADFPFHLMFTGECKVLDGWISQMMDVAEPTDLNALFIKITRKGKFVCVQSKFTWKCDVFFFYSSKKVGDWLMIDFDHFFEHNAELFKSYSNTTLNI